MEFVNTGELCAEARRNGPKLLSPPDNRLGVSRPINSCLPLPRLIYLTAAKQLLVEQGPTLDISSENQLRSM